MGECKVFSDSMLAGGDLSEKQFRFVKISAARTVVIGASTVGTLGDPCYGVLQNNPESGEMAEVMVIGISKCVAGDTITAGAYVKCDANGAAIPAADKYDEIMGIAREDADSGDIFSLFIHKFQLCEA
jgi:hypothetical protein